MMRSTTRASSYPHSDANAVHPIPQIPDELPVPGTLIHVDGRTAYAPRTGETLKTIADQLCGVSCSEGRVGPPPLSEGGSAPKICCGWLS